MSLPVVLQVEKGVALRARMELERLRADKEEKEQKAKDDAERARRAEQDREAQSPAARVAQATSSDNSGTNGNRNSQEGRVDREASGGGGYEPERYGRDDPYRRQEDVERERVAQQATAAAMNQATSPGSGAGLGSGSRQGVAPPPPPKSRPPPKVLLSRGQEEVVQAGTGARIIQPRHIPLPFQSSSGKAGPQEQGARLQAQAASIPREPLRVKPEESYGKSRAEPSQILLAERPGKGLQTPRAAAGSAQGCDATDGRARGEPSSVSLQWLTPRRDGDPSTGDRVNAGGQGAERDKKGTPSAWARPADATPTHAERTDRGGNDGSGPPPLDRPQGGAANRPPRSPRQRPGEREQGQGFEQHKSHAPPSPFGKDTGRTFSSLFVPPGQEGVVQQQQTAGVEFRSEGLSLGYGGGGTAELGHDWPEAGRGPPPREQKQIFDHKTGKMRKVEDSDKSRTLVNERPRHPPPLPQDARMAVADGRAHLPGKQNHEHPSPQPLQGEQSSSDHNFKSPVPIAPESVTRGAAGGPPPEVGEVVHERREPPGRRLGQSGRDHHEGGGGRGAGRGWDERREWTGGRGIGRGRGWEERRGGGGRERDWGRGGRGVVVSGRSGGGRGGRGEGAGRDTDNKTWERGLRPVIARTQAHAQGGRGHGRDPWEGSGSQASSSRRRVSHLDDEQPVSPNASMSIPAAVASASSGRDDADGGGDSQSATAGDPATPSPAIAPVVETKNAGTTKHADRTESPAQTSVVPAPKNAPWGRQVPAPTPAQLSLASRQELPVAGPVAGPIAGHPHAPPAPAVHIGGSGVGCDLDDDREAIRARDERERDLAVQQRRSVDANAKAVGQANWQQQQQQSAQAKKEAEKVGCVACA